MKQKWNPKVSIIIPVYNGENYLREAIESALAQTYKNIEVLVVNDGSTDKTEEIALSYDDTIRYFKKENGGVATALNLGIKKMKGEYFSWLSHDDLYYPDKIKIQIDFLSSIKDKNVVLYSNYDLIDENDKILHKVKFDHDMLTNKPEYSLYRGCINGITLLIPSKAFEEHGFFNFDLRCTQDYDMWSRIIKTYQFIHMNEFLSKTRLHSSQDSKISPAAEKEGNKLWIRLMQELSLEAKIRLENSEYFFYKEMSIFLETTPYKKALDYSNKKQKEISKNIKKRTENIKVTVIIPFYNRIDLLISSIDSVLNNTHKNSEILLVNDCSTDDIKGLNILLENKNIKLINLEKNGGPSIARNIGIENATGEYIAFLDSDDLFTKEKIDKQLFQMLLYNSDVSHTSYIRKNTDGEFKMNSGVLNGKAIPKIIGSCGIATPTVMIKREHLMKNNFRFNEKFKIGEDTCFWFEILRNTNILGIQEYYTIVNTNESSAAYNFEKQMIGIKNILTYVLNDEEFKMYNNEIVILCNYMVQLFRNERQNILDIEQSSRINIIRRCYYILPKFIRKFIKKSIIFVGKLLSFLIPKRYLIKVKNKLFRS